MHSVEFETQVNSLKNTISDLQNKVNQTPENMSYQAKLNLTKMRLRYILQSEEQRHKMREVF